MVSPRLVPRPAATVTGVAAVAAAAAVLLAGCGDGARSGPASRPAAAPGRPAAPTAPGPPSAAGPAPLPVAPGAGRLHQTPAFPGTASAGFRDAMADLWLAVTTGQPALGQPGFFPLAAYEQVKAISDPGADWRDRLWHDFALDVAAAHRLVGGGARLVRVVVPASQAAWIGPGGCYNAAGYWHVGGARVVYRKDAAVRSFGIASLISWRGEWYVVHLGAVLRSADAGTVDQPAYGTGIPGPPGGC